MYSRLNMYIVPLYGILFFNDRDPNFTFLKPHSHISSICISIGNMYIIGLCGIIIMNVAVLNIILFKYPGNISMIDLVHGYSNDVVN